MSDWFEQLATAIKRDGTAVIVTVIAVGGSVPREVGATLVVAAGGSCGTIGGGNLEYTCIRDAREMLSQNHPRVCKQVSLGPGLGQCCGGRVELLLERVSAETDWYLELSAAYQADKSRWLCRSVKNTDTLVASADQLTNIFSSPRYEIEKMMYEAVSVVHDDNTRWFYQPLAIPKPAVMVYGAGHVGQAVISQLSLLDCQVTLLDHREEWLHLQPDIEITRVLTDTPEDDAVNAPNDAVHIVMTHSHALDFEICHALLKKAQFGWLGLIGSDSKRQTFINRLKQRGLSQSVIDRLRCPIGNLQLESSQPALISLSLAAELVLNWEQEAKMHTGVVQLSGS